MPFAATFPVTPPPPSTLNFRFEHSILFSGGFLSTSEHSVLIEMKALRREYFESYNQNVCIISVK